MFGLLQSPFIDAVIQRCSLKKVFLEITKKFTENHMCQSLSFLKKETLAQGFSCEFYKFCKNTIFHRTNLVAASAFILEEKIYEDLSSCTEKKPAEVA